MRSLFHMVPWPSGKARVCKTLIRQFKSGRYLQTKRHPFGCLFCFMSYQARNGGEHLSLLLVKRRNDVTISGGTFPIKMRPKSWDAFYARFGELIKLQISLFNPANLTADKADQ